MHTQTLTAPVGLENERSTPQRFRGLLQGFPPDGGNRVRGPKSSRFQRMVLRELADFQVQRPMIVEDAPPVALQPVQGRQREFRSVAMPPRVRRRTHAVVEYAFRRCLMEGHGALIQQPFLIRQPLFVKRLA